MKERLRKLRARWRSFLPDSKLASAYWPLALPLLLWLLPATRMTALEPVSSELAAALDVRVVQAGRVRILLARDRLQARVQNSQWKIPVALRFSTRKVELWDPVSGRKLESASGLRFVPDGGRFLVIDGLTVRGRLEAFFDPQGRPVLINELSLEDYLAGVVPLELGPDQFSELEAQKAQSIAARSYGLRHLGLRAAEGFDLYADVRSQVYGGQKAERELSNLAVLGTRGEILVSENQPILAFYSSTCGGQTAPFREAFEADSEPAYLAGGVLCQDEQSRYRNWRMVLEEAEFLSRLTTADSPIQDLNLEHFPNGRLARIDVRASGQKVSLSGRELRERLSLRSTWITSFTQSNGRIEIEGRGFGHGVGLCQTGAFQMAAAGQSARQILTHYYPGSRLLKVY